MTPFLGEVIGTGLLMLLGNGVVANTILADTKGHGGGWLLINMGWAIAVFVGVFVVADVSGAHINPAVTIGLAVAGNFDWGQVPTYVSGQMLGAAIGAALVWIVHKDHFDRTEDQNTKLAVFCTGPAIRNTGLNLLSEIVGTFVLVFGVLYITGAEVGGEPASLGSLDALPVALLVMGIGMSLGGTTGYAINPARDLAPRIMHEVLPVSDKRDSDWEYSWIPVAGPIIGGVLAAALFLFLG